MIRMFRPFRKPNPIKDGVGTLLVLGTALLYTFEAPGAARAPACEACEETQGVQPAQSIEERAPVSEPAQDVLHGRRRSAFHHDTQEAFGSMYRRILVPLDGSDFAERALPYALSISRRAGSEVELVSVEEDERAHPTHEWSLAARQWAGAYLEETRERAASAAGGPVTTELLQGNVSEALVRRAADGGADLVIMATHGRGALSRAWLGSVADAVVRRADLPVLLVRPGEERTRSALDEDMTLEHILVPLDGSDFSRSILEPAVALGSLFGARYTVLRVLALPTELASPYLPHPVQMNVELVEEAREAARVSAREVATELESRGFSAEAEVVVDAQAVQAILRRASELDCQVIALATHARGGMSRMILGSTSDKVIRGAHRPVLVLRPEETRAEPS